jgi:hypothetical protein
MGTFYISKCSNCQRSKTGRGDYHCDYYDFGFEDVEKDKKTRYERSN